MSSNIINNNMGLNQITFQGQVSEGKNEAAENKTDIEKKQVVRNPNESSIQLQNIGDKVYGQGNLHLNMSFDKEKGKSNEELLLEVEAPIESKAKDNMSLINIRENLETASNLLKETEKLQFDLLKNRSNESYSGKSKSVVVVNKETDSLKNLLVYDDSSENEEGNSEDEENDSGEGDDSENNWQLRALETSSSSDASDSDEDSFEESSDNEDDTEDDVDSEIFIPNKNSGTIKKDNIRKDNEVDCLPPVPDLSQLNINVENEEFMHIGSVASIIEKLVTIEAIPGSPAFDLDSYLFIEEATAKKPIGQIFDVLGPVTSPLYCVRFNTPKEIEELKLKQGTKVFVAPKSEFTKYVFVKELMKMKGSDASWKDDQEIPPELVEFSDDEEEHSTDQPGRILKRKHGSLERHRRYEKTMNQCNILNTRVSRLMDAHRHIPRPVRSQDAAQGQLINFGSFFNVMHPAPFDPTIPPPGFSYGINAVPSGSAGYPSVRTVPNNMESAPSPMMWGWPSNGVTQRPAAGTNMAPSRQGQNNSANYQTNHTRNHPAGPSSYPF